MLGQEKVGYEVLIGVLTRLLVVNLNVTERE